MKLKNLTLAAMFTAMGLLLPLLTGQIKEIGSMLLPMHIPVLLCGLICGHSWGAAVGLILPPLRYLIFGMPVIFPTGISMALELCVYGMLSGLVYEWLGKRNIGAVYGALASAMLGGRIAFGLSQAVLLLLGGSVFTPRMFLASAFVNALPGIILQLVLIPTVMVALDKLGVIRFGTAGKGEEHTEHGS